MSDLNVRIETLTPMRVASFRVISAEPEHEAWLKLQAWAEPRGLLGDLEKHPVFGFNNPNPSQDREEYGYEFWIKVDPDVESDDEARVLEFQGGRYAVTTCKLVNDPNGTMPEVWMKLYEWVKDSEHEWQKSQELEKPHDLASADEDLLLDLYLPIEG
jgi:DNA gyrase inhibitor GyrI